MRLRKGRRPLQCVIDIAPLIDVVFLLLIFFMTVSQFTRVQVEPMALPPAEMGELTEARPVEQVVINVDKSGRIVSQGTAYTPEALTSMLAGRSGSGLSVLIRGDRDADWRDVATVLRICSGQGIGRVRVAVIEANESDFTL